MADLKTLLGDKYTEGMSIEDLMALEIEEPKVDMSKYVSKEIFDKTASEAANYKKQARATMSEAEQKALEDAEKYAAIVAERDKLLADKTIAEHTSGLVAIGYDEKSAKEVAAAFMNGDFATVISATAKFVDAQKKSAVAERVKGTPIPPVNNDGGKTLTKEEFSKMTLTEQLEVYNKTPELYNELTKK
jgi:hypothetical protein